MIAPGAIEAALEAAGGADEQAGATRRTLELELRQARYETDRAQRQYDAVEPEHRLVVETLERRWNAALERVAELEQRLAALAVPTQAAAIDRASLLPSRKTCRPSGDIPKPTWHSRSVSCDC